MKDAHPQSAPGLGPDRVLEEVGLLRPPSVDGYRDRVVPHGVRDHARDPARVGRQDRQRHGGAVVAVPLGVRRDGRGRAADEVVLSELNAPGGAPGDPRTYPGRPPREREDAHAGGVLGVAEVLRPAAPAEREERGRVADAASVVAHGDLSVGPAVRDGDRRRARSAGVLQDLVERLRQGAVEELHHLRDRLVGDPGADGPLLPGRHGLSLLPARLRRSARVRWMVRMSMPRPRAITAVEAPACRHRRNRRGAPGLAEHAPAGRPWSQSPPAGLDPRPGSAVFFLVAVARQDVRAERSPLAVEPAEAGGRRGPGRGSSRAPRASGPCARRRRRPQTARSWGGVRSRGFQSSFISPRSVRGGCAGSLSAGSGHSMSPSSIA